MATVTLHPGAVTVLFNPSLTTITGSPPQLADSTDATWYESRTGGGDRGVAEAPLDSLTTSFSAITAIDIYVRAATDVVDGFDVRLASTSGALSPSGLGFLAADITATPDGNPYWYTKTLPGFTISALTPVLTTGTPYLWLTSQGETNYVRYFEAYLLVTYTPLATNNPLRRYPPVNNGGSGPTRHYPRTVNRRAGGTY